MKHTADIKGKVRALRSQGLSLNEIQQKTTIPKTTIRLWISNIELTEQQKDVLLKKTFVALQEGRKKAQLINKERRVKKEQAFLLEAQRDIGFLTKKELFIAGVALYWAEGFKNKHEYRLGFCNSDSSMILFYLKWLHEALGVDKQRITARVSINYSYKEKTKEIEDYWSEITGIPLSHFTKTFYQNTQWRKEYEDSNYHGVLRIHVKESLEYLLKMKGWIEGLKLSTAHARPTD